MESTIPAGGAARLHARLLDALERIQPREPAVLSHHAVAAGDAPRAARYAQEAASEAARTGSHTEAVAFLHTALDNLNGGQPGERARLLMQLAYEQYMISRLDPAIESITTTFPLWRAAGDPTGLSAAHVACATFEYYNAHRQQAEDHAERAAGLADDKDGLAYGAARAARAYLAYHRSDYHLAGACSTEAARVAQQVGNEALGLKSQLVQAVTDLALGVSGARQRCVAVIEDARQRDLDELASTGYSNLAYLDVEQRRLSTAERVLEESLAFTVERDIPICNHWQTAVRSRLRLVEGRWSAALEDADRCPRPAGDAAGPGLAEPGHRTGAAAPDRDGERPARCGVGTGRSARRAAAPAAGARGVRRADVADRHARRAGHPARPDRAGAQRRLSGDRVGGGRTGRVAVAARDRGRRRPRLGRRAVPADPDRPARGGGRLVATSGRGVRRGDGQHRSGGAGPPDPRTRTAGPARGGVDRRPDPTHTAPGRV